MNIAEQIHLKYKLKEDSEVKYKSDAGGFCCVRIINAEVKG